MQQMEQEKIRMQQMEPEKLRVQQMEAAKTQPKTLLQKVEA